MEVGFAAQGAHNQREYIYTKNNVWISAYL